MMVERYTNLKEEVSGFIPGCELSSQLGINLAKRSTASCALVLACRPFVSKINKSNKQINWAYIPCDRIGQEVKDMKFLPMNRLPNPSRFPFSHCP